MLLLTERRDLGSLKRCHVEKTVGGVEVGRENRFWGEGLLFSGVFGLPVLGHCGYAFPFGPVYPSGAWPIVSMLVPAM